MVFSFFRFCYCATISWLTCSLWICCFRVSGLFVIVNCCSAWCVLWFCCLELWGLLVWLVCVDCHRVCILNVFSLCCLLFLCFCFVCACFSLLLVAFGLCCGIVVFSFVGFDLGACWLFVFLIIFWIYFVEFVGL